MRPPRLASRRALTLAALVVGGAAALLALSGGKTAPSQTKKTAPPASCNAITFEGARFTECVALPGRHRITTAITGSDGVLYRGFARLVRDVDTKTVAFGMNGGMYGVTGEPIGYYVENRERLARLNRRDASGNFYLKPNGVFFGEAGGPWRILTTDDFAEKVAKRPEFGTQSGPMLLIDGKVHPKIAPDGASRKIRNAVGIDAKGRAHFVISEDPVSFGLLAKMLRDHAGARDALFLDGTVSALWDPERGRMDGAIPLGPLIVISTERKSAP